MTNSNKASSFYVAAGLIITAIFLFDVVGVIIKLLSARYPAEQLSMFRNVIGLAPTLLILLFSKPWIESGRKLITPKWKLALFRGALVATAQFCYYLAISKMAFATAASIAFSGPLFVTALSIPFLGEKVGGWRWMAVVLGFTGVLLVIRPGTEGFSWYLLLPLCASACYATVSITSKLFDDDVPTALINLYSNSGAIVGATLLVLLTGGYVPVANLTDWMWLIAMGFSGGLAVFCLVSAYRRAEPSSLSPFEYFGIPFSFLLGWVFFTEAPFEQLFPGVLLIVAGGLMIVWRENALKNKQKTGPSDG